MLEGKWLRTFEVVLSGSSVASNFEDKGLPMRDQAGLIRGIEAFRLGHWPS